MSLQSRWKPCPRCGGTHFQKATLRQYIGGTHSAAPGGELYELDPPFQILVCLCGEPVVPPMGRSLTPEHRNSLQESLTKALNFRQQTELEAIMLRLLEEFPRRSELEKVKESVAILQKVVRDMEKEQRQ